MEFVIKDGMLYRIIPAEGETIAIIPEDVVEVGNIWSEYEEQKLIKRIVFSEGLKKIDSHGFRYYANLESVVLPASISIIESSMGICAFNQINLPSLRYVQFKAMPEKEWIKDITGFAYLEEGPEVFTPKQRTAAITGFIEAMIDNTSIDETVKETYETYIKGHAAKYAESVTIRPAVYRYLLQNNMIKPKDIDKLLEIAKKDAKENKIFGRLETAEKANDVVKQLSTYKKQM